MKEIAVQLKNNSLHPFSEEDLERLREYKPNQVLKCRLSGIQKPRSYLQLKLYFGACQLTSENTDDPNWNTKEKVDFQCRVATHFVDPNVVVVKPDGTVIFSYRSIAFKNLRHIEACNYFDRAFEVMAKFLKVHKDKLIEMVKSQ